jgi:hypothetical protein
MATEMRLIRIIVIILVILSASAPKAMGMADHTYWPTINGSFQIQRDNANAVFAGTDGSDELLGHHGDDWLYGRGGSDVLWGDWDPLQSSDQATHQHDHIYGGGGSDFIYSSHGYSAIYAGAGNDAISIHYGRGILDCGSGRDIWHVAKSRRRYWKVRHCEVLDYRTEAQRGGGLKPLP